MIKSRGIKAEKNRGRDEGLFQRGGVEGGKKKRTDERTGINRYGFCER